MALPEAQSPAPHATPAARACGPGSSAPVDRQTRDGCGRWVSLGCLGMVVLLLVLLLGSFLQLDRGARWVADRALARLRQELPGELSQHEREQLLTALDRVEGLLSSAARDRVLGPFLRDAGAVLEDDRITADEVVALTRRLDALLADAPPVEG